MRITPSRVRLAAILAARSLGRHRLSTAVTVLAAALASGLVMATFTVAEQGRRAFSGDDQGFDAVLGARGSAVQLVLNAVFHLDTSPGNLPWTWYERMRADPRVEVAVPCALGDNHRGYRVVGTTTDWFEHLARGGGPLTFEPGGRPFDPSRREVVVGSTVASRLALRPGSVLHLHHGLEFNEHAHQHDEDFQVVGVLAPTGAPSDRLLLVPLEATLRLSGHVLRGAGEEYEASPDEEIPAEHREVSAVLLRLRGHQAGFQLSREINRDGREATLAWPLAAVMAELFDRLGAVSRLLELIAWLTMAVAAAGILASLHNTMRERRRDLAVLRAMGARRGTVAAAVLFEGAAIGALGGALGLAVLAALGGALGAFVRARTGVAIPPFAWHPSLAFAPAAMTALGVLAAASPAVAAYRVEVADELAR